MANKEGQGALFRNTEKQSDKQPDYSGVINIGGKDVKLSGWIREAPSGLKYISLAVNNYKSENKGAAPKTASQDDFINDEVPF